MRAEPSCPLAQHRCDCSATLSEVGSWPCDNAIWPPGARKSRLNLAGIGESEKFVPLSRSCLED